MIINVPKDARIETKFIAPAVHLHAVLGWLRLHPAGFVSPYPDRRVNNIYFDTPDCDAYAQNLTGASSRIKVRYRWYGESRMPGPGSLEIKLKRNCFGWKMHFEVPDGPCGPESSWGEIRRNIRGQLSVEGRRWFDGNPVPVLLNSYLRRYFVCMDGRVRVTVDSGQRVWEQRLGAYPNLVHDAGVPDAVIVEFKFDKRDILLASRFIQGIPIRMGRYSKYISGMRALQGS